MEADLNNIISRIKAEGVAEAEKKAEEIIRLAGERANEIAKKAESEKAAIIERAKKDAERLTKNGEESLKRASRDVMLALKGRITALFDGIIKEEVTARMSPDALKDMILKLTENFKKDTDGGIEILLSEKDLKELEKTFHSELKGRIERGVTFKVSPNIENGFRIGKKGENSYYDFTDDAIAETFKAFLNPRIAEKLDTGG